MKAMELAAAQEDSWRSINGAHNPLPTPSGGRGFGRTLTDLAQHPAQHQLSIPGQTYLSSTRMWFPALWRRCPNRPFLGPVPQGGDFFAARNRKRYR
jgi:hypothetical protein